MHLVRSIKIELRKAQCTGADFSSCGSQHGLLLISIRRVEFELCRALCTVADSLSIGDQQGLLFALDPPCQF